MRVLPIATLAFLGSSAAAQETAREPYIGLGLASFDYEQNVGEELTPATFSDTAAGFKLYGGHRFAAHFALEGSYQATDTVEERFSGPLPDLGVVDARLGADFDVLAVRGIGHVPLSWGSFFVGAGYFDGDFDAVAEIDAGALPIRVDETLSESGATAIVGLQWDLDGVSLRGEYEWWDIDEADAFQLGLALHYRF